MNRKAAVESELKYRLERKYYERLLRIHRHQIIKSKKHINYYFDDIHLNLRRKRIGLRIRIEGRKALLTLKYPKPSLTKLRALKVRREFESPLPIPIARKVISGALDILSLRVLPIRMLGRIYPLERLCRVRALGSIETHRTIIPLNGGMRIELDRFCIFGLTYYEMEVETKSPVKADRLIYKLLWKYDIPYRPARRSKLARFLEVWRDRQK